MVKLRKMFNLPDLVFPLLLVLPAALLFLLNKGIIRSVYKTKDERIILWVAFFVSLLVICILPAAISTTERNLFQGQMPLVFPWTECPKAYECHPGSILGLDCQMTVCYIVQFVQRANMLALTGISAFALMINSRKTKKRKSHD